MASERESGSGGGRAFESDGVRIAYDDEGEGPPIVLVHGFASNRRTNWRQPAWYRTLADAGRRVIALDCRGHGESDAPHDPEAYRDGTMAEDVVRLLDHLAIPEADVMGYSMGGRIAAQLLTEHPERVNAVVLAGIGTTILDAREGNDDIAEALEADDPGDVTDPVGRRFRAFAEQQGGDLAALAALQRAPWVAVDRDRLSETARPVLVVAGEDDDMVGDPRALADVIPGAEAVVIPERDHMTTVGDERYKDAVLDFLDREGL